MEAQLNFKDFKDFNDFKGFKDFRGGPRALNLIEGLPNEILKDLKVLKPLNSFKTFKI